MSPRRPMVFSSVPFWQFLKQRSQPVSPSAFSLLRKKRENVLDMLISDVQQNAVSGMEASYAQEEDPDSFSSRLLQGSPLEMSDYLDFLTASKLTYKADAQPRSDSVSMLPSLFVTEKTP